MIHVARAIPTQKFRTVLSSHPISVFGGLTVSVFPLPMSTAISYCPAFFKSLELA
ncbi:hypothetical protein L218DRAFT_966807 [Marasmius fiardii PR-910]|nr:hypothetical protein L218DRAFT_966807 [Marasmius fiardii PR-910]